MRLFTDNPDFYPTPEAVIQQMMIGTDIAGKTVLEPSAGTGNIVDWLKANGAREVIACENDPHIRKLLNGKCDIIAEDFLTVTSDMVSHIDCIVMNPPFSSGAKHILHAWQIAPPGCSIVALCNSSNLESYNRRDYQELQETIELYGNSEWLGEVFKDDAERRTRVSVSLVKLYKGGEGDNEWDGYFFSSVDEDAANSNETEGIMQYNMVRELVNRYVSAVKLFDDTMNVARRINETAEFIDYYIDDKGEQQKRTYGSLPIKFCAVTGNERSTYITHDQYKKELQKYYWNIIFKKLNMEKYATQSLRAQINRFIEMQKYVPFTMGNVYRVIDMVIQTTGQRMQKALLEAFDHICSFSAENSTAGEKWKTNANYMVNKKFIVPYICSTYDYDTRKACLSLSWSREGSMSKLEDVNKALCYITGTNYDEVKSLSEAVRKEYPLWGEWFNWGFFRCKGYKKGTMHFEFLDEDVYYKFNYEVSKQRGWSLPKRSEKKRKAPKRKREEDASGQATLFGAME